MQAHSMRGICRDCGTKKASRNKIGRCRPCYFMTAKYRDTLSYATRRAHEKWLGTPEQKIQLARARLRAQEIWIGSPEQKVHLARIGKLPQSKAAQRNTGLILGKTSLKNFHSFAGELPASFQKNCSHWPRDRYRTF